MKGPINDKKDKKAATLNDNVKAELKAL